MRDSSSAGGSLIKKNCYKLTISIGCVLTFALAAAKSNGDYLPEAFATERAAFVNRIGIFAVGFYFDESSLQVLGNLLGAVTATNTDPNSLISINYFTADGTFFVYWNRFFCGEGTKAKNGGNSY